MLQATVLWALRSAREAGGDDETAYRRINQGDPLLRGLAYTRISTAFREALRLTTLPTTGKEGHLHLLALTYLIAAKQDTDLNPDDRAAVEARYRSVTQLPGRRPGWWLTISALLLLLAGGAYYWHARQLARQALNPYDALARAAPPPSGAFAAGGAPAGFSAAIEESLREGVPALVIALDRRSRARADGSSPSALAPYDEAVKAATARLLSEKAERALGPNAFARLREVVEAASAPVRGEEKAQGEALLLAIGAFNDALAAANLGYYLDGDVLAAEDASFATLYAFAVEHVSVFESEGRTIRALTLRRLDTLNISRSALGLARPQLREALLLREEIDSLLINEILPALAESGGVQLADEETSRLAPAWLTSIEQRAGEAVRAEYGPKLIKEATDLGRALARRRALFRQWQDKLSSRGLVLSTPERLEVDASFYIELAGAVPEAELDELRGIQTALTSPAAAGALEQARRLLASSVERHEVQHRLDFSRAEPLPMPTLLEYYVGPLLAGDGSTRPVAQHARDELSAYLGELARDPDTVKVNLALVGRFLLDRGLWGTVECNAALVILREISSALSLPALDPLKAGQIEREQVTARLLELLARDPNELRAAAARAYETIFQTSLPVMTRRGT